MKTYNGGKAYNMFGQAPYVINAIVNYASKKLGTIASLSYNVQGPRLVIINTPDDIYEIPRHVLDFKVSKSIGKHFSASLKVNDVLASIKIWKFKDINTDIVRAYKIDNKYNVVYDKYGWGTNYVFAVSYKF